MILKFRLCLLGHSVKAEYSAPRLTHIRGTEFGLLLPIKTSSLASGDTPPQRNDSGTSESSDSEVSMHRTDLLFAYRNLEDSNLERQKDKNKRSQSIKWTMLFFFRRWWADQKAPKAEKRIFFVFCSFWSEKILCACNTDFLSASQFVCWSFSGRLVEDSSWNLWFGRSSKAARTAFSFETMKLGQWWSICDPGSSILLIVLVWLC